MDKYTLFKEFEKVTDELLAIDLSKDTDQILDVIEDKLKKREDIIEKIKSNEDKEVFPDDELMVIIEKNNRLESEFLEVKLGISKSISEVVTEKSLSSKKKKAHRGYMNVGRQNDGYFIDKKK